MLEIYFRQRSQTTTSNTTGKMHKNEREAELLKQELVVLNQRENKNFNEAAGQPISDLGSAPKEQEQDILIDGTSPPWADLVSGIKDLKENILIDAAIQPWADLVSGRDRRFSELLGPSSVVLFERIENALDRDNPTETDTLSYAIGPLKERIEQIESLSLEDALLDLFTLSAGTARGRNPDLIRRFGWNGKPPETLQKVGERVGVTRERIRQIQSRIVRNLPQHPVYVPQLQKAINALEDACPIAIKEASELLKAQGISQRPFHPKSVIAAASDCKILTTLKIQSIRGKKIVIAKTDDRVVHRLASIARAQSGSSGATDVPEVLEQALEEGLSFEEERGARLIRNLPNLEWLADDWFCVSSVPIERNRLRNIARKMLSVTSPIHARKIRAGMRRVVTYRNSAWGSDRWPLRAPPEVVVQKFFEQHPEFRVDTEGLVYPAEDLDYAVELGDAERHIVDAIRSTPAGVIDRQSIRDRCIRRGVNQHTFEQKLTYSPLIEHLGVNLWAIASVAVDPAAVEAVRVANARRPREKRVSDFGWTEKGEIWISVIVPSYNTSSFVFGVPGGVKRYLLSQRFIAMDDLGKKHGEVVVSAIGTTYGAGPLLRRKGADAGDIALFEFNLAENIAVIRVGGDELVDGMQ